MEAAISETLSLASRNRAFDAKPSAINEAARQIDIIFATEFPALRFDYGMGEYLEILDCTPQAADLSRLTSGGAFLSEHDRSLQIGVHRAALMAPDRTGRATVEFGFSAKAQEEWQDVKAGIRSKISVSYLPLAMRLESVSDSGPDTYRVTSWQALENSLVSVPADNACQIGRSDAENLDPAAAKAVCKVTIPENLKARHLASMTTRNRSLIFHEADRATSGGASEFTPEQRSAIKLEGQKEEQTRTNGIREWQEFFGKQGKNCRSAADQFIKDGKSPEEFRQHVMIDAFKAEPLDTQVEITYGAIQSRTRGDAFVNSPEYRQMARRPGGEVRLRVDIPYRRRDIIGTSGLLSIDKLPGVSGFPVQLPTVAALMNEMTTDAPVVRFAQETRFNPTARGVAEAQLKPDLDVAYVDVDARVQKIAVFTKMSMELIDDFPEVAQQIDGRLGLAVDIEEDRQILQGSGSNSEIVGILTTPGIMTYPVPTPGFQVPEALFHAQTLIATTAFMMPDAWVFHPLDWEKIKMLKDQNGQFLGGGPFYAPYGNGAYVMVETLWGRPVVSTTAKTQGSALCGAFRMCAHPRRRMGMIIEATNSNEDDFRRNLISMRAETRLAFTVERPVGFCEVTNLFPA